MRLVHNEPDCIEVVLSDDNLLTLLDGRKASERASIHRRDGQRYIIVRVEGNEEHYADRPAAHQSGRRNITCVAEGMPHER